MRQRSAQKSTNQMQETEKVPFVVAKRIREAILGEVFKPGDRLTEAELVEKFEVSRSPIRATDPFASCAAIQSFESQGYMHLDRASTEVQFVASVSLCLSSRCQPRWSERWLYRRKNSRASISLKSKPHISAIATLNVALCPCWPEMAAGQASAERTKPSVVQLSRWLHDF